MSCRKSIFYIISILFLVVIIILPVVVNAQDNPAKKIIYETDMCADVDDVGGLAILHALANMGKAEILAVCFNEVHPFGAAAIDAINTWYGRGDIPVGIYKGTLNRPDGSGYLEHVAKFPHDLEKKDAPSALDVYRQVLSQQPDSSVTIVSVGFTNNLNDLLIAEPDLVAQKVKELVQMAGLHNDGFNLTRHNLVSSSENVIRNWPTPLVISQEGSSIHTGDNLKTAPEENPVREAFYRYFGNEFRGRPSWDEMAVLYGVRGLSSYFYERTSGTGSLPNGYIWQMNPGIRSYLSNRLSNSSFEHIIEQLMDQLPIGAHFDVSTRYAWLGSPVEFDASISIVEGNRTVQQYLWDFGDGTSGEGELVTHDYSTTGTFDVQLIVIDNIGDTLRTTEQIYISDPIFSPIDHFGNVNNYETSQADLWSTRVDSNDVRLYLSNEQRDSETSLPGFCFVKDSTYSDFTLSMNNRTGEDLSINSYAEYSIIFGYQDEKNYNYMLMKHSTSRLVSVSNGSSIAVAWTKQKGLPDDEYHHVNVRLSGEQLVVSLDDSVFLESTSFRWAGNGKIGFGSTKYAMFFDDVNVTRLGPSTGIKSSNSMPLQNTLNQNYPNPFNPSTEIEFSLTKPENVKITVFNIIGQKIETLLDKSMQAGNHKVVFDGRNLNSGVYLYKINAGEFQDMKKMLLVK